MAVCDECNGWLNPALAADSAVRRGDEVLLIQRKYPPMAGSWAFPGGFVEQGESVEEACRRETMEESGIRVGKVLLHSTQPWPIGRAGACELMIGCMAHAISTDINVDTDEKRF